MEAVFLKLLNMGIAAGWLILAVLALRVLFKKVPKALRVFLWLLVGVRLLFPFSIESMLSLVPSAEIVSPDIMYDPAPTIHSGVAILNSSVNPVISESLAPKVGNSVNPMQVIVHIATLVWLAGVAFLLLYGVVGTIRLHRRVSTAVWLRDNLWQSEMVPTPFVLGVLRPRIYLPAGMDAETLRHVVAHENAHLKRRDHWMKPIGFLLLSLYWFHPLLWVGYAMLSRDIELACDERVVKHLGMADKKAYSSALLACSVTRRAVAAYPLAFGESDVRERIQNVLDYRKPGFWIVATAIVLISVLAVGFLTNPKDKRLYAPEPFCHSYRVSEIVYDAPQFSFTYTPESAPIFCLTADYVLTVKATAQEDWQMFGGFEETILNRETFDDYFVMIEGASGWRSAVSQLSQQAGSAQQTGEQEQASAHNQAVQKLRRENRKAWRLVSDETLYLVLLHKNGDIYLAQGYLPTESTGTSGFETGLIRWLFRLEVLEEDAVISQGNTISSGTGLLDNPGSSGSLPPDVTETHKQTDEK